MKISIITVCRNAEATIEQCIKSVVTQTYSEIEYLIIDGGSQDRTKAVVLQYLDSISQFISEPDQGVYDAMNKGIQLATGSLIYFLNSDDYLVDETVIEDVADFVSKQPSGSVIYGNLEVRSAFGLKHIVEPPHPEEISAYLITCSMPHQATFTRADVFEKVGLFDLSYRITADTDWYLRVLQDNRLTLTYYPRTIASYYSGGASSDIRRGRTEFWQAQNNASQYQTEYWIAQRLLRLQEYITSLEEQLAACRDEQESSQKHLRNELQALNSELKQAQATIAAMETSKFWQIRQTWFQLKKRLNLPIK